jgi:hypothetical protein
MSGRYRRSFRALGRCLIVALAIGTGLGAQVSQPEPATKQKNAPAQIQIPELPFPVRIIDDDAEKKARDAIQERTENRERDDLLAQQGMEKAAEDMVGYAHAQTWLIGIGTILLLATLVLTRQANQAAWAAVAVTREMGEAQARAYVSVSNAFIIREGGNLVAAVEIQNFGQTPAYDLTHWNVTGSGERKDFPRATPKGGGTTMGPGAPMHTKTAFDLSPERRALALSDTCRSGCGVESTTLTRLASPA